SPENGKDRGRDRGALARRPRGHLVTTGERGHGRLVVRVLAGLLRVTHGALLDRVHGAVAAVSGVNRTLRGKTRPAFRAILPTGASPAMPSRVLAAAGRRYRNGVRS